jgi:hypothetical protein
MSRIDSPWISVVAAIVGGIAFGWGMGRLVSGITLAAAVWTLIGVLMLWWAFADHRKWRRGTPESEADGSHTIE